MQHQAIANAAVVGVKNHRYGEVVGAFLEARKGASRVDATNVQAWVREQLAYHKAPVHIFWVGDEGSLKTFPLTGSGKIQKEKLKGLANSLVQGMHTSSKL